MDSEQSGLKKRSISAALLFLLALAPRLALGQEPVHSLQELQPRVRVGDTIRIVDPDGKQTEGKFNGLVDSSLRIQVNGATKEFREPLIREIDLKYRDSLSDGLRKGALIGVAAGVVFGLVAVSPEGCESSSCTMGAAAVCGAIGAGIGAASGALGDSMTQRYITIFSAPRTTANRWGISPVLSRETKGVKFAFHF